MCFVFVTVVKCPGLKKAARKFKGLNWSRRNGAVGLNSLCSPPLPADPFVNNGQKGEDRAPSAPLRVGPRLRPHWSAAGIWWVEGCGWPIRACRRGLPFLVGTRSRCARKGASERIRCTAVRFCCLPCSLLEKPSQGFSRHLTCRRRGNNNTQLTADPPRPGISNHG